MSVPIPFEAFVSNGIPDRRTDTRWCGCLVRYRVPSLPLVPLISQKTLPPRVVDRLPQPRPRPPTSMKEFDSLANSYFLAPNRSNSMPS